MIHFIIVLAILGFAAYILLTYVPMPVPIKQLIVAIIAIFVVIALLNYAGVGTGINTRL